MLYLAIICLNIVLLFKSVFWTKTGLKADKNFPTFIADIKETQNYHSNHM